MKPRKIKRASANEVVIEWDDQHSGRHTTPVLRRYCPCAACKSESDAAEETSILPIIKPGQFDLSEVVPVGNYALQLIWRDGHRTGIYTFEHLRQICECEECSRVTSE